MIRLENVSKEYRGPVWGMFGDRVRALDGVDLEIPAGTALGIVGPNGAGKSTLLRLLLGYIRPSAGEVRLSGAAPREYAERHGIGYVPERPAIPPRWTVRGALKAYAALGEAEPWSERVAAELDRLGLTPLADRRVGALSKGNLQRLAIAQALLAERKHGVDPEWTARVREILGEWRAADPERVILFASHNLDEVERVADRVAVLAEGRLREVIDLRAPRAALPPYRLEIAGDSAAAGPLVAELFPSAVAADGAVTDSDITAWRVTAPDLAELNRRVGMLLSRGVVLHALVPLHPSLEQEFHRSLQGSGGRATGGSEG